MTSKNGKFEVWKIERSGENFVRVVTCTCLSFPSEYLGKIWNGKSKTTCWHTTYSVKRANKGLEVRSQLPNENVSVSADRDALNWFLVQSLSVTSDRIYAMFSNTCCSADVRFPATCPFWTLHPSFEQPTHCRHWCFPLTNRLWRQHGEVGHVLINHQALWQCLVHGFGLLWV